MYMDNTKWIIMMQLLMVEADEVIGGDVKFSLSWLITVQSSLKHRISFIEKQAIILVFFTYFVSCLVAHCIVYHIRHWKKYSCWGPKRSTNLLNIPPGSVPSFVKNTDNWLTWSSSPDPQRNYSPLLIRKLTTDIMKRILT